MVPKQIDRGTACLLGRGLKVLCGVRLIIKYIYFIRLLLMKLWAIMVMGVSYGEEDELVLFSSI